VQNVDSETTPLSIEGMTCEGCANVVTRALSRVPGVTAVAVDLKAGRARVEGQVSPQLLVAAVLGVGFGARPMPDKGEGHGRGHRA
jgi:copper chaperone CopZ